MRPEDQKIQIFLINFFNCTFEALNHLEMEFVCSVTGSITYKNYRRGSFASLQMI